MINTYSFDFRYSFPLWSSFWCSVATRRFSSVAATRADFSRVRSHLWLIVFSPRYRRCTARRFITIPPAPPGESLSSFTVVADWLRSQSTVSVIQPWRRDDEDDDEQLLLLLLLVTPCGERERRELMRWRRNAITSLVRDNPVRKCVE